MGMGMAMNAGGIHAEDLFAMGQQRASGAATVQQSVRSAGKGDFSENEKSGGLQPGDVWTCGCGAVTAVSSVRSAAPQDRNLRHRRAGSAAAVRKIKANSVRNAVQKSRRRRCCTAAISAAGNRKIRQSLRSSARSAEIPLMKMTPGK